LEFASTKSKKSLVFVDLMSAFPVENEEDETKNSFLDEHIFLISSSDLWYGDILIYLQTLKFPPNCSRDEQRKILHMEKNLPYYRLHFVSARGGLDP